MPLDTKGGPYTPGALEGISFQGGPPWEPLGLSLTSEGG